MRTELLGPVGKRLTGAAAGAAEAAKDAAKAELGSLPLSKDAARAQVSKLLDQVGQGVVGRRRSGARRARRRPGAARSPRARPNSLYRRTAAR